MAKTITQRAFRGLGNEPPAVLAQELLMLTTLGLRYLLAGGMLMMGLAYPIPAVTLAKDDSGEHVIPPVARPAVI